MSRLFDNRFNELLAERDALAAECNEQARLNGMGAERELALMAKVNALAAESEARHQSCLVLMNSVTQYRARVQALEAALREISPAVRDVLWCALVWNDHNFQYSALREHAHAAMTALGLDRFNGVDAVNEWMARVDALLKPTKSIPAATSETHPEDGPDVIGPAATMPTRIEGEDAWIRAYIARMVERGVDKEDAEANADSIERSQIDLTVHPESAADDEMSYWDADE